MEKLTDRFDNGDVGVVRIFDKDDLIYVPDYIDDAIVSASIQEAIDKLAEYEDTGLIPAEILQMKSLCYQTYDDLRHQLNEYRHTSLTPEKIKDHEEMFKAYRHICGGKSPEEIKRALELLDADEQGLLLRTMCKVGDLVYEANTLRNIVSTYKVTSIIIMPGSINYRWQLIDGIYSNVNGFNEYALGKSVFLTREEAEKVLKDGTSKIRGSHNVNMDNPLTASIINTMVETGRKALKGNRSIDSR